MGLHFKLFDLSCISLKCLLGYFSTSFAHVETEMSSYPSLYRLSFIVINVLSSCDF